MGLEEEWKERGELTCKGREIMEGQGENGGSRGGN